METIIVKDIEIKADKNGKKMAVLQINGNRKVSVGSWLEQEVDFIANDVGVGDVFDCELKWTDDGKYLNIKSIAFSSLKKYAGTTEMPVKMPEMTPPKQNLSSLKDTSIIAQVCIKEANNHINALAQCGTIVDDEHYEEVLCQYSNSLAKAYFTAFEALE